MLCEDLQFYVQYIPELKEINVPKGYVISHGETHFSAITRFMVDKQEISINSKLPFIYGESAKEVFKIIKPTSTISYVAVNPLNNKESDYEVSGKMIEQLPAALKILERTWSLYKKLRTKWWFKYHHLKQLFYKDIKKNYDDYRYRHGYN